MSETLTNEAPAAPGRMLLSDRIYGAIGVAAVLLALFFLVRGGAEDGAAAAPKGVPVLVLLDPLADGPRDQPVTLTFDARSVLSPDGSDAEGRRHVHARIGASELMPAPGDIRRIGGGTRYEWTLPRLPAGSHAIHLYWSDAGHRPIAEGGSDSVVVQVR